VSLHFYPGVLSVQAEQGLWNTRTYLLFPIHVRRHPI